MMGKALHTKSIWKSNLMTDIRLASEAGFGAMEVAATKIWDYLSSGNPWSDVTERLNQYNMKIISINDIAHVERTDDDAVREILAETEKLSAIAQQLGCDCIQLVPLLALEGRPEEEGIELTAKILPEFVTLARNMACASSWSLLAGHQSILSGQHRS